MAFAVGFFSSPPEVQNLEELLSLLLSRARGFLQVTGLGHVLEHLGQDSGLGRTSRPSSRSSSPARAELATSAVPALDTPVKTEPQERRVKN